MSEYAIRSADADDIATIKRALYLAGTWRADGDHWPPERLLAHPYFHQFWSGWGQRRHDLGIIAESEGSPVGAAFARLFTSEQHAHGFVDEDTPEIAVGVEPDHRQRGVGTALLERLGVVAADAGLAALSLSVELDNPALRLYQDVGFVEIARDDGAVRMLWRLDDAQP